MPLNTSNKNAISYKLSQRKAHTQQDFADYEESIPSNVSIASATIFAQKIDPNPVSNLGLTNVGDTDNIVERIRFEIDIIPDTQVGTNQSQGYKLKLPAGYSGVLSSEFSGGTYLYETLGKLQIIPSLYGELKGDGTTEYDPVLYQTNDTTEITKYDVISWNINPYNGVLFVQDPPSGYDVSASRPGFLEAFLFVGDYLDNAISGITSDYVTNYIFSGSTGTTDTRIINIENDIIFISGITDNKIDKVGSPTVGNLVTLNSGGGIDDSGIHISGITGGTTIREINIITTTGYTSNNGNIFIGASGATLIYLPSTPIEGDDIIVTDMLGDAGTNSITIDGNGYNIVDDTTAIINTDYGSITFLYNGYFWSVIAFIN